MATDQSKSSPEAHLGLFMFGVAAYVPFLILGAWIRSRVWGWFAVPYLHLPPLTILQMIGVGFVVSTFTAYKRAPKDQKVSDSVMHLIIETVSEFCIYFWAMGLHAYLTR